MENDVIHLRNAEASVVFEGLSEQPMVSVLRDFSAPVTLVHQQPASHRLALARLDANPFNRWRAMSDLVGETLVEAARSLGRGGEAAIDPMVVEALVACAADESLHPAFRAQMLVLPSEADIARLIGTDVDPLAIHGALQRAATAVGLQGETRFASLYDRLAADPLAFSPDAADAGRRALANALLDYRSAASGSPGLAAEQYGRARNMTDRLAALRLLAHRFHGSPATRTALADFYKRFEEDALVIDKWFAIQATVPDEAVLAEVEALASHPKFKPGNPNRARALVGAFAAGNQVAFNRADGAGYRFVAGMTHSIDRLNPQIAARIATAFRSWRSFEVNRSRQAHATLEELARMPDLSADLRDIVDRSLR